MNLIFFQNDIFLTIFLFKPQHYNAMRIFKNFQEFLKDFCFEYFKNISK